MSLSISEPDQTVENIKCSDVTKLEEISECNDSLIVDDEDVELSALHDDNDITIYYGKMMHSVHIQCAGVYYGILIMMNIFLDGRA